LAAILPRLSFDPGCRCYHSGQGCSFLLIEPADNLKLQKKSILKISIKSLLSQQIIAPMFLAVDSINQPIIDGENL